MEIIDNTAKKEASCGLGNTRVTGHARRQRRTCHAEGHQGPPPRRRRVRKGRRIDRRTRQARRVAELVASFTQFFGGDEKLTPVMRSNITRAAELVALAEGARAAALRGITFDVEGLTKIEMCADRAVRRLALPATKPLDADDADELGAYLAGRAAAPAAASAAREVAATSTPTAPDNSTGAQAPAEGEAIADEVAVA